MLEFAPAVYKSLHGLFAVYKPPGVKWKMIRDTVETRLLEGLNSLKQPLPQQQVRFLPEPVEESSGSEVIITAIKVPALADHPLVKGPAFKRLKVGAGHLLDVKSSGVFVLGVGHGNKLLTEIYNAHLTKDYVVHGQFGKATDDFSDTGRLIEKTTYDHITEEQLERILAVIQGTNLRALLEYSRIDLKSQEAYELAAKGLLRPIEKTSPVITGVRCLHFAPPDFMIEIQCLHETQQYLRQVIHKIGLALKSTAVCTHVRRIRDGFFTLDDALIRTQWDLENIRAAIQSAQSKVKLLEANMAPLRESVTTIETEAKT